MIELKHVSKSFRSHRKDAGLKASLKSLLWRDYQIKHALRPIDLRIEQGELVGLLGANGAGKTTLVKICTGIIRTSSGQVSVLGQDPWSRDHTFRRSISLIMGQKAQLWWDLPAADCFLLLREIYQVPKELFEKRLRELCSILEINAQLKVQIRQLSLGERMKMELIAALLHQPKMIFLDEPTIGLDITSQRALRDFIKRYHEEHKPTIILTSHYMEDIQSLCKRIIVLREGAVIYDGLLDALVKQYSKDKVVTIALDQKSDRVDYDSLIKSESRLNSSLFEISSCSTETIKLCVRRDYVSHAASVLLEILPVIDLNIQEPDVASIVANIQRHGFEQDA